MTSGPPHHYPPPGAPPPEDPPAPEGYDAPGSVAASYPSTASTPGGAQPGHAYAPHRPPVPGGGWNGLPGAAHKPGAIPLRPLSLGSMYDGAFRIIRYNPKATVGAAVLVTALAQILPILVGILLTFVAGVTVDLEASSEELSTTDALGLVGAYGAILLSSVLSWIGLTLVTGMMAYVVRDAAVGRKLTLAAAWAATRGRRWRLIGLTLLVTVAVFLIWAVWGLLLVVVAVVIDNLVVTVVWGAVSFAGFCCLMAWTWIRLFYLPVPALMLEDVGVFGAIARGYRLTRQQFWRTFGIGLLTVLVASVAGGMLSTPVALVFQLGGVAVPEYALFFLLIGNALSSVVQNAFVGPFISAVTTLQYVDLRMRKEAYDVELMGEAGLLPR